MTLHEFINEFVNRSQDHGYDVSAFAQMREEYGTYGAVRSVVEDDRARSGLEHLQARGLAEWSLEAAVVAFAREFPNRTVEIAQARLEKVVVAVPKRDDQS